jgi:hypothetical protein
MKRCQKCNTQWPDDARFCPKDGTRLMDSEAPDAEVTQAREPIQADAGTSDHELTPEEEAKLDQARQQGFSETQWFMLAQNPDRLKESPSTEDLYEMQEDYDWDDEVPEEERRRFSLRKPDKKQD